MLLSYGGQAISFKKEEKKFFSKYLKNTPEVVH